MSEQLQNPEEHLTEKQKYYKEVGKRLLQARRQTGLNQAQMAKQMGMGRSAYGQAENGRRTLSMVNIVKFMEVLERHNVYISFAGLFGVPESSESANRRLLEKDMEILKLKNEFLEYRLECLNTEAE